MRIAGKDYPRAWPADSPPKQVLFGASDLGEVFPTMAATTVKNWLLRGHLPAADGPDVNRGPTWTRELILIWAYSRNLTPVHLLAETHEILQRPGAQQKLEECTLATLLRMV